MRLSGCSTDLRLYMKRKVYKMDQDFLYILYCIILFLAFGFGFCNDFANGLGAQLSVRIRTRICTKSRAADPDPFLF